MTGTRQVALVAFAAMALSSCVVNVDRQRFIEHVEKRFPATSVVELRLETFDGPIDVRAWDNPEVRVDVEKRGPDKASVSAIEIVSEQVGDHIRVEARHPASRHTFFGWSSPSAGFVVNVPRKINLIVRTGDGSIRVDRVDGRIELRSGDGSIRATETSGDLYAESGDGSIQIEDVTGKLDVRTGDGSLRISGKPQVVRARTGDGSVVLRVQRGTAMTGDWSVTTGDGSISAQLPDDFDADIEADPGSGRTRSEIVLVDSVGGTRERRSLRGRLGQGGHAFLLRTGDGTIRLTKD